MISDCRYAVLMLLALSLLTLQLQRPQAADSPAAPGRLEISLVR